MAANSRIKNLIIEMKDIINRLDYEVVIQELDDLTRARKLLCEARGQLWEIEMAMEQLKH